MLDPKVVSAMVSRLGGAGPMSRITPREREVLSLMAQGRSNAGIAAALFVTENAVSKHINSIFGKLNLPTAADDNRRVLAVLEYLRTQGTPQSGPSRPARGPPARNPYPRRGDRTGADVTG